MGFRCAVYGCGNIPKEKEISLHEFPPKSDRKRHMAWTNFISRTRDKWRPTVSCHVCSEHFFESDFENKLQFHMGFAKKLVLKKDAVPSVYPKCEGDASSTSLIGTSHSCSQTHDSRGQSAVQIRRVYRKPYLRINLEQSDDSPPDGVVSKFSESDGEVQDCSEHDVVKIKNEKNPNMYVDPLGQMRKNELTFIKEESLHSNFEFTKREEEQEERYYEVQKKLQNPGVRIKTEQSDHSPRNHIISKFSENNNEGHDCTYCDVLSLKKEPEEEDHQINSEDLSETQNCESMKSSSGGGFHEIPSRTNNHKKQKSSHNGNKPYSCIMCSKKFGRNYHLKEHMRTHTGEKPYECVVCGKQFLSNGNLKTHQRIHTGEKPYSCVVCGREFRSNSHLKRHKKLHIVEDP